MKLKNKVYIFVNAYMVNILHTADYISISQLLTFVNMEETGQKLCKDYVTERINVSMLTLRSCETKQQDVHVCSRTVIIGYCFCICVNKEQQGHSL